MPADKKAAIVTVDQFRGLQDRVERAVKAHAEAERDAEVSARELARYREELKKNWGTDDPDELRRMEAELRKEAEEKAAEVDRLLKEAGF